jgi:hypothetical protein
MTNLTSTKNTATDVETIVARRWGDRFVLGVWLKNILFV